MEKRHAEFALLTPKATESLLDGTPPHNLLNAFCELLVSIQPTFANWTSWVLFSVGQNDHFHVRRTIWDKMFDQRRFFDPLQGLKFGWDITPTITVQVAKVAQAEVAELWSLGRRINAEPGDRRGIVLDGERWFLKLRGAFGDR